MKEEDYEDSIRLHSYYNNALNYSDCTILKTMQNKGIYKIASFDEGFDKIKGINRIS